jgi:GntR family transcriptional regulator/MocR family aminotransferase
MRDLYTVRRQDFLDEAARVGAGLFDVERPDSGMNALLWLPEGLDDRVVAEAALAAGVHSYPLADYSVRPVARPALILGFAGVQHHQLGPGLATLARVIAGRAGRAS